MLQRLTQFFSPDPLKARAQDLYIACVTQARNSFFYNELHVPDTLDGRFDMVVLHVFLLLRRLKGEEGLARALTDAFFVDMDRNLRELGVGDPGVGKRIRKMVDALYGRIAAYEDAWEKDDKLQEALKRNIYAGNVNDTDVEVLLGYVRACSKQLHEATAESLREGSCSWPVPSGR